MSIWDFASIYSNPVAEPHRITLGEGHTPLVRSRRIGPAAGITDLYFKLESTNPTGSYKDRFAAAAVSHLVQDDSRLCLGCSSGNTGAALAAYSAAVALPCVLAIVDSAPEAKLDQMRIYGAKLVRVKGFGTDADKTKEVADRLSELAADLDSEVQISAFCHSPRGMEGVMSISHEIAASERSVRHVFCPAGAGGLVLAVARGFAKTAAHPAVHCVQPVGNDTIATRLRTGAETAQACICTTHISGLQVANVMDGDEAIAACRASGGSGFTVTDEKVLALQSRLAAEEGIFAEPAGVVALAGALQAVAEGVVDGSEPIVCLVTGAGFKDDVSARKVAASRAPTDRVDDFADFERIVRAELSR